MLFGRAAEECDHAVTNTLGDELVAGECALRVLGSATNLRGYNRAKLVWEDIGDDLGSGGTWTDESDGTWTGAHGE